MTAEQKRWWKQVVAAVVGGGVVAGGLFGIVRATAQPQKDAPAVVAPEQAWARAATPPPLAPSVAEVERTDPYVTPASGSVPIPSPAQVGALVPALPAVPTIPLPVPPAPLPSGVEVPAPGPRAPDAGLVPPALPGVPALPSAEPPKLPAVPLPEMNPGVPPVDLTPKPIRVPEMPPAPGIPPMPAPSVGAPALPPLPGNTAAPMSPGLPAPPALPPLTGTAPTLPPAMATDPAQPMLPAKPDSGLNPAIPGNTLNPALPVVPPSPIAFPPVGGPPREAPGTTVDRPKPTDPAFGTSDKFVFPAPAGRDPLVPTPRDPAMFNLHYTAALAVIGGAMMSAEQARSAALVPVVPAPVVPAIPVKADAETDALKADLKKANDKIAALETQVKTLTELLTGRKDLDGKVIPSDPGAVENIKRMKDRIFALETEITTLKSDLKNAQTALKPAVVPEVKPKGVVKVVNEYPVEISMVINDTSYRIAPTKTREIEVPAGEFTYQLLQSGAAATRSSIKDKETVTLRIK